MPILPPILVKPRRPRKNRRKPQLPSAGPPPVLAHAVSVGADGSNFAIWSFDQPIVSLTDAAGLTCPASGAVVGASVTGTTTVAVEYELPVTGGGGDVWECVAANVTMTFDGGGGEGATLQDGTGYIAGS